MVKMSDMVIIKKVDKQGRVVLPKEWRDRHGGPNKVLLIVQNDTIILKPYKPPNLTRFFDRIQVDLKSDLSDWKSVRRELLEAD